ncbi:putative allantoate permease [Talaromyces proteolyticus]|uniref:Allantoate permease n=1 Tax=Talaromyces proteolyticus TaxID=1131652 RepID=A0AAD4KVK7_9EURO|nr:putative allantoate permease [Talaromyces proteolyticus]KAH8697810.1 putative allantoate permease [Talaromyces proteolyticus]
MIFYPPPSSDRDMDASKVFDKKDQALSDPQVADGSYAETCSYTPEEERRVVRKLDLVILPMMCCVFFLQYLDKQSLSYASIFGLIPDLKLEGKQYSWTSSIFYFGQLVSEYPFIYLMSRLPLAKFVGATVVVWGGICMCLAAPHNFAGFATVRFILGFAEGAVSPAFVTITSIWYRKSEHPMRVGIWVTMNGLAQVVGSLLMYGIGKNGSLSLQPWRVLFLICGAMTTFCGAVFFFIIPNGVSDAWFLSPREKEILVARMAADREGGDRSNFSVNQFKEGLIDIKSWFVFAFGLLVTLNSSPLTFASLVIKNIGYNKFDTLLYGSPSGALQILFIWISVLGCFLFPKNRCAVVMVLIIPPLVGNILLLKLPLAAGWGVIVASWLASLISDIMTVILSLSASNVKGNTKRAMVNTFFFIGYCVGCIAGPQAWTKAPRYLAGVILDIVVWCLLFLAIAGYWYVCARDNARRDCEQVGGGTVTGSEGIDVTDKEDQSFRYSY